MPNVRKDYATLSYRMCANMATTQKHDNLSHKIIRATDSKHKETVTWFYLSPVKQSK